jgi:hypothetical protein
MKTSISLLFLGVVHMKGMKPAAKSAKKPAAKKPAKKGAKKK